MTSSTILFKATLCACILVVTILFVTRATVAKQSSPAAAAPLLAASAPLPIVPAAPFSKPVAYPSEGRVPNFLSMADVNGDSIADLIVLNNNSDGNSCFTANPPQGTVSILLGNSDGTFKPAITYDSGGFCPVAVTAGDLNGDGHPDVIVLNCDPIAQANCPWAQPSNVGVLLGNGDGTFSAAVTYNSADSGPGSVLLADFNADGKVDVAIIQGGTASILLGNGDGSLQAPVSYDLGITLASGALGDVNGDGKPDLVARGCFRPLPSTTCLGAVAVLLGNGNGTFQSVVSYDSAPAGASGIAIGDLNGDGHPDLVFTDQFAHPYNGPGLVTILLGNGDGTFGPPHGYYTKGQFSTSVAIADINLDGIPDVIVSSAYTGFQNNREGRIDLFVGNGDGTFQPSKAYAAGANGSQAVLAGDFNRDGKSDIALANACADLKCLQGSVTVLLNVYHLLTTTVLTSSLNPSFVGQSVTFTATISSTPTVPDGTSVNFTNNGTLIGTGTTTGGVATVTTSLLKAGTHTIKATYGGSAIFKVSSASVQQVVNRYPTTTTLVSSLNPSSYRQSITWTATVTSSGPVLPTGVVKFGTLGYGKLIDGVATLTKSGLTVGTYAITAQYQGDAASLPSSSRELDQVINPASTTTSITSSRNPSRQGQSVTFTAKVTSSNGLRPVGSVTFTAAGTVLGTITLGSAPASVSTSSLPVGTTVVQAVYSGDTQFVGSSVSLNQTVNP